jgi:hypothetical protein
VDRIQPALLALCLFSTVGFAVNAGGNARTLAVLAAGGLLVVLVGSVAWLVPIQRQFVVDGSVGPLAEFASLRTRWLGGHLIRTVIAMLVFVFAVVAALI